MAILLTEKFFGRVLSVRVMYCDETARAHLGNTSFIKMMAALQAEEKDGRFRTALAQSIAMCTLDVGMA